jgi:hypothetical protein
VSSSAHIDSCDSSSVFAPLSFLVSFLSMQLKIFWFDSTGNLLV